MARLLKDNTFFDRVRWNPHLKVVMDHNTGQVVQPATNEERRRRGLCPWSAQVMDREMEQPSMP
jgi:hypothetical protein